MTETERVHCAVRNGCLNITEVKLTSKISRRNLFPQHDQNFITMLPFKFELRPNAQILSSAALPTRHNLLHLRKLYHFYSLIFTRRTNRHCPGISKTGKLSAPPPHLTNKFKAFYYMPPVLFFLSFS